MLKSLALALVAVPLALVASSAMAAPQSGSSIIAIPPVLPFFDREPIVNLDVTGSTLLGAFHSRMTVYSDGLVTGSDCGGFSGSNSAGTASATKNEASMLHRRLLAAGGLTLPDNGLLVSDVPLTTVTVWDKNSKKSNTFSFFVGGGQYSTILQILNDFAAKHPVACQGIIIQ